MSGTVGKKSVVSVALLLVTTLVVVSVVPHTGSLFASAGRIPICDLKGNCDEEVEETDPNKADMTGSSGIPSYDTMRRIAQFSDIQRLIRRDPSIRDELMHGLAKKVPQLYEAIRGREDDFIKSLVSDRHIGSTLDPDEYVVVSKKSKKVLDYAVQEGKLITYRWVNTPNQKWSYTTEGTFELKQLPPNQMSTLDVWSDVRDGVEHHGVMAYSKHGNANQRWVVSQHGQIISLTQSTRNEVLLLTMGADGVVTVAPPDSHDPESQQWSILPTSRIPQ